jgi:transposase
MALPVYQRYEIIFLSQHLMGPKLSHAAVAKAVRCDISTVKYWLKRWKQSKDLSDLTRSGRPRATTTKQDQQIISLAEQQTFITSRDITNKLNRKGVMINERTVQRRLNEAGARYNRPLSKPLLTEVHRKNRLKWARDHKDTNWEQVIFSDETTIRLNSVKGLVWNLPGKKKIVRTVKHPIKVNVWG